MKIRSLASGFALGATSALCVGYATSQEYQDITPETMKEMIGKATAAMTPGPAHRRLDPFIGEWETTTKIWMGGPSAPPTVTKGTATKRWILDGRFILTESEGDLNWFDETGALKPRRVKGLGLTGYDNHRNLYVGSWADSLSTHLLAMRGAADPSGKVFSLYGEMDEPMLGVTGRYVKYVTWIADQDRHVLEIYDLHAADDFKAIEIEYRRAGDASGG